MSARRTYQVIFKKKKISSWIVAFAEPEHHRVKLTESDKRYKYSDLASKLEKETVRETAIDALGTVHEGLERSVEELKNQRPNHAHL